MCTCISACAYTCQVSGILILYDKAQEIQHQRHCNMKADVVPVRNDDCYFWPRSIYGGSQVPVWHCLRKEDISEMPYSFRFGLRVVNFLRKTSMYYIQNKEAIASPMENPKSFSSEELARVPETKIRIVNYQQERLYGCTKRGVLANKTVRLSGEYEQTWGKNAKAKERVQNPTHLPMRIRITM